MAILLRLQQRGAVALLPVLLLALERSPEVLGGCRCGALVRNIAEPSAGCCQDEEVYLGLCYKQCSLLTDGKYPHRTAPNTCCKSFNLANCLLPSNTDTSGFGCLGYGVDRSGGCAKRPCNAEGSDPSAASNPAATSSNQSAAMAAAAVAEGGPGPNGASNLSRWLQQLKFMLPAASLAPGLELDGGSCSGLKLGPISAEDVGSVELLEMHYRVAVQSFRCRLLTEGNSLAIDMALGGSQLDLGLAIETAAVASSTSIGSGGSGGVMVLPLGKVRVTRCALEVRLKMLDFDGSSVLTPGLELLRSKIVKLIHEDAPEIVCAQLEPLLKKQATNVLGRLRTLVAPLLLQEHASLLEASPLHLRTLQLESSRFVDWAVYPPVQFVIALLAERGEALSRLLQPISDATVPLGYEVPANSSMMGGFETNVSLQTLRVNGLESVLPHSGIILNGSGQRLGVSAAFGRLSVIVGTRLQLGTGSADEMQQGQALSKDLNFTLMLNNISVALQMLVRLSRAELDALYVDQMQSPSCLANCADRTSGSPALQLVDLEANIDPKVGVTSLGDLEADLTGIVEATASAVFRSSHGALGALIRGGAKALQAALVPSEGHLIDRMPSCSATKVLQDLNVFWKCVFLGGAGASLAFGLILTVGVSRVGLKGMPVIDALWTKQKVSLVQEQLRTALTTSTCCVEVSKPSREGAVAASSSQADSRLALQPFVPQSLAVLFPCMILSALLIMLYSDFSPGTLINVVFTHRGEMVTIGPAFTFSMASCVRDAWKAGAYAIVFLVLGVSGIWPVVKLLLLAWTWLAPNWQLPLGARTSLLEFLDEYGRFGLIDTWLALFALAVYRLKWTSSDGQTSILVDPVPTPSFLAFIAATVASLVLGHIATAVHRRTLTSNSKAALPVALAKPTTSIAFHEEEHPRALCTYASPRVAHAFAIVVIISGALLFTGGMLDSFHINTTGLLASFVLEMPDPNRKYGLVTMGTALTDKNPGNLAAVYLRSVLMLFAFIIPLMVMGALLVLWVIPLSKTHQQALLVACRTLFAWSAYDVFVLTVCVARYEMELLTTYLVYYDNVGVACSLVRDYLQDECIHIKFIFEPGFVVMLVGGIASYAVPKAAFRVCQNYIDHWNQGDQDPADSLLSASELEDEQVFFSETDTSQNLI